MKSWTTLELVALLTALALATPACGGGAGDDHEPVAQVSSELALTVQGTVRDAAGGPLSEVELELRDQTGGVAASAESGPDGGYALGVESGVYDLVLTPPPASIFSPQTFPDRELDADATLDIVLVATARPNVVGRIVDDDGTSLPDLDVCLTSGNDQWSCAITDENGSYSLGVSPGEYDFYIDARSDAPDGLGSSYSIYRTTPVDVGMDTTIDVTIPIHSLSGEVREADGQAGAGARVEMEIATAFDGFEGGAYGVVVSDELGGFDLLGLPGSGTLVARIGVRPFGAGGVLPVTVASADQTGLVIDMPLVVPLTGRFMDDDGNPLMSQRLCLDGADSACTNTDSNGNYSLLLQPADYSLRVFDGSAWPANIYYSVRQTAPVGVTAGTTIDLTLPTRTVSGVVQDSDGAPMANTIVFAEMATAFDTFAGSSYAWSNVTDASGAFQVLVPPGNGSVTAMDWTSAGRRMGSTPIVVEDIDIAGVVIGSPPPVPPRGRITDDEGNGLPGQQVRLNAMSDGASWYAQRQTDANGHYWLDAPDGEYVFGVQGELPSPPGGRAYAFLSDEAPFFLDASTTLDALLPTRLVSGEVRDTNGEHVAGVLVSSSVEVSFETFTGQVYSSVHTDENGQFSLTTLPGTGTLSAWRSNYPGESTPLTVADADLSGVGITTPTLFRVSGHVLSNGAGVRFHQVCLDTCGVTDEAGYYSLETVAGDYQLAVFGTLDVAGTAGGSGGGGSSGGGSGGSSGTGGSSGEGGSSDAGAPTVPAEVELAAAVASPITIQTWYSITRDAVSIAADTTIDVDLPLNVVAGEIRDPDGQALVGVNVSGMLIPDFDGFQGQVWSSGFDTDESARFWLATFSGNAQVEIAPPPSGGLFPLTLQNLPVADDLTLLVSVQFLSESAVEPAAPAGGSVTTDDEGGDGATPADPIETTVMTPNAGPVSIEEGPITEAAPGGFTFLTQQIEISAPPGSTGTPLELTFFIDETRLPPGADETDVEIFRNGVRVKACVLPPDAIPDPCVASRSRAGDDVVIVVLTSAASHWNVGIAAPSDRDGDGTLDAYDGCPDDGAKTAPGACGCAAADDDSDGDGSADCVDGCPADPAKVVPGACGCGVPDDDSDDDGALDCEDPCPNDANDACLDPPDGDGDGVADDLDRCEGTPAGEAGDARGCSIADLCPCAGPRGPERRWRNHASYVACVADGARAFQRARLIDRFQVRQVLREAERSRCGREPRRPPRPRR